MQDVSSEIWTLPDHLNECMTSRTNMTYLCWLLLQKDLYFPPVVVSARLNPCLPFPWEAKCVSCTFYFLVTLPFPSKSPATLKRKGCQMKLWSVNLLVPHVQGHNVADFHRLVPCGGEVQRVAARLAWDWGLDIQAAAFADARRWSEAGGCGSLAAWVAASFDFCSSWSIPLHLGGFSIAPAFGVAGSGCLSAGADLHPSGAQGRKGRVGLWTNLELRKLCLLHSQGRLGVRNGCLLRSLGSVCLEAGRNSSFGGACSEKFWSCCRKHLKFAFRQMSWRVIQFTAVQTESCRLWYLYGSGGSTRREGLLQC